MRITAFILLVLSLHVTAKGVSQTITLSGKDIPLTTVFEEIKKQSGYVVAFTYEMIQDAKPITVYVKDEPLTHFLDQTLNSQGFEYVIENRTIVLRKHEESLLDRIVKKFTPPIDVKGIVVDENGTPSEGASVSIKGTSIGTSTNYKGEFTLKNVDQDGVLIVTSVGYNTIELSISGNTFVSLQLSVAVRNLDELQVIAYGKTSKRLTTGNVNTVKAFDIQKQPVNNPLLALQGRVPGLFITQNNGLPGTSVIARIQGQSSILKGNDPLYVVDGVPYISQLLPTANSTVLGSSGGPTIFGGTGNGSGNPLSFLNPTDIESIDILKDADATAIYGSRAANGAILITTKSGKSGKTKADVNIQSGRGTVARRIDLLNRQEYLQMRKEAIANDGGSISPFDYDVNGLWDTTRSTDWQKQLIGGTANYNRIGLQFSGGNSSTQYLFGGNYQKETGIFPGDLSDQKTSVHFSLNSVSLNQKFKLRLSANYLIDDNRLPNFDITSWAMLTAPNAPLLYNPDGSLNWASPNNSSATSSWFNPLAFLLSKYNIKTNNLITNAVLGYQLTNHLDLRCNVGYTNLQSDEVSTYPSNFWQPELRPYLGRSASFGNNSVTSWIIEPQATYTISVNRGKLETLIGTSLHQVNSNGQILTGSGFNNDIVIENLRSASSISINSSTESQYKYAAVFGRLSYNWSNKYIINVNIRRDGSSRFGAENQFQNFGSAGAAWVFTNEKLFSGKSAVLSFGKLRASYGTSGNDQIGEYQFMNLYSAPEGIGVAYQSATGLLPVGHANPNVAWELTKKLQAGLDLGLYNDRVLINTNYYRNRSTNQLLPFATPLITGFSSISTLNLPATVQNSGFEFSVATVNFKRSKFEWASNFNLTVPKNKLRAFPDIEKSSYAANTYVVGQPLSIQKVYHFVGVDANTGVYQFSDGKGGVTDRPDTSQKITQSVYIDAAPKYYGGFENSFKYKNFQLDILLQFVKQLGQNNVFGIGNGVGLSNTNQPRSVLDRWQEPGDVSKVQRFSAGYNYFLQFNTAKILSDAAWSDASYVRVKNVSLSWQITDKAREKLRLAACKVYVQAQNLFTITRYRGLDPETRTIYSLPPLRVITIGVQASL